MDDMEIDDLFSYRLGIFENEVKQLLEDHYAMSKKIELLEKDFQDRFIRKKVYKLLFAFYPVMIMGLLLFLSLDHHRIVQILTEIKLILPSLTVTPL